MPCNLTINDQFGRRHFRSSPGVVDARVNAAIVLRDVFNAQRGLSGNGIVHRVASDEGVSKCTGTDDTDPLAPEYPVDRYQALSAVNGGI